jgi:small subunit ribosomal protein S4
MPAQEAQESVINIMARDLTNKCKLCRRAGEKLFLKGDRCGTPKCSIVRRAYPPGVHGAKGKRNQSEFGQQLAMKQKMKRVYGILERQFKKYFTEVKDKQGVTGDLLLQKLEARLDNVIYRAGFAANRRLSRQLVRHSHFTVNGKKVNIPSFEVKVGDFIQIKPTKTGKPYFKQLDEIIEGKKGVGVPAWLEVDSAKKTITIKSKSTRDDIGMNLDAQMVVEFYSR